VLPLAAADRIAVVGGYAQIGVPCGTGSSAVTPPGGYAAEIAIGGPGVMGAMRNLYLHPSPPLAALAELLSGAQIEFEPGMTPAAAALAALGADVAIVFAIRVEGEGFDNPDLSLPWGQDAVIDAVASANPNTVVVLETGNPVAMPWRENVRAIVQAWYPGQAGGQAIAEILTGAVNPSGRLPVTFPADLAQTPRPELPGLGTPWGTATTIHYDEGAEVGYRWFADRDRAPLYAFGHGLSYTRFEYDELEVAGGDTVTATFTVTNAGDRDGTDVPQLYLTDPRMRLLGFERVALGSGESRRVTIVAEPRLLARYDMDAAAWHIAPGAYRVAVGRAADDLVLGTETELTERRFGR
jgi:beta-glucosidase